MASPPPMTIDVETTSIKGKKTKSLGIVEVNGNRVTMALASRLDVKADDIVPPQSETWLPAYAVAKSGALLCAQSGGVVLHATYAYLEDAYFGLDQRLACGTRDNFAYRTSTPCPITPNRQAGEGVPQSCR